ncbi:30S ribosomal protein S17 [Coxiella endosymbiont of Amblyomma sculptum]|nr:30S ribosomal protein S17 [Coxiella endosymbiont of Amblyomma sculptum]
MDDNKKKSRVVAGTVISNSMRDTIVVLVAWRSRHLKYGKFIRRFTKLYVHDQGNKCQKGDIAVVYATRPISKTKKWILEKITKKAKK